jgi:hypothetical protein
MLLVSLSVCSPIATASSSTQFSMGDILAMIQIVSPVDNSSYNGDVSLNVNVTFQANSHINSTVIPYQDITCVYRLDSGEWRNASLNSVSEPTIYWSLVNRIYTIYITCTYNATLQVSSNGLHSISVDVKPDAIHAFDSRTYRDNNGLEYHYLNSTVNFYVSKGSGQPSSFLIVSAIASIGAIAIISAILLVYLKKRKRQA